VISIVVVVDNPDAGLLLVDSGTSRTGSRFGRAQRVCRGPETGPYRHRRLVRGSQLCGAGMK